MNMIFGVDVGGTNIKFGLFNKEGILLEKWEKKTEVGLGIFQGIADEIAKKKVERKINSENLLGVGLGVPGPVKDNGQVELLVNLGLNDVNFPQEVSQRLNGISVKATNDANAAALGEMWQGGGRGYENLALITLGTGVGAGLVLNSRILNGLRGVAGEIGHIVVAPEIKEYCNCGGQGCLEQISSATGVVRHTQKLLAANPNARTILREKTDKLTAKDVVDAAKEQDSLALISLEYCMEILGKTLADMGQVLDPEVFIIGGGLSHAGDFLLDMIKKHYQAHSIFSKEKADIVQAQLGNDAGIYGAAKLILG